MPYYNYKFVYADMKKKYLNKFIIYSRNFKLVLVHKIIK